MRSSVRQSTEDFLKANDVEVGQLRFDKDVKPFIFAIACRILGKRGS
jgi:hypothetical protein